MFKEMDRMTLVSCYSSFEKVSCSFLCNISEFNVTSICNLIRQLTIWRNEEWFGSYECWPWRGRFEISRAAHPPILLYHPTYLIRAQSNKRREMFSINLILRMTVVLYYRMESPIASSRPPSLFLGRRANRSWSAFPSFPSPLTVLEIYSRHVERLNFSIV